MLHVAQYLYPNGPPMGPFVGTGGRTGENRAGIIPGSEVPEIQRKINADIVSNIEAMVVKWCDV